MSYDPFESEVNYPPHQKESRQPPLRELSLRGEFEDNVGVMFNYFIRGEYHEDGDGIRIIEHKFLHAHNKPFYKKLIPQLGKNDLYWILAPAIQDYLKITGTIHFDSKLEI